MKKILSNPAFLISTGLVLMFLGIYLIGTTVNNSYVKFRVKVIENNTITYMEGARNVYKNGDTVWLDLTSHEVCDTCSTAVKAVIEIK